MKMRLRLSLRVWMFVILCLAGYLARQVHLARKQREAVAAIKSCGGFVAYDWEVRNNKHVPGLSPTAPAWLRGLVGDEYFQDVKYVTLTCSKRRGGRWVRMTPWETESLTAYLAAFPALTSLTIYDSDASDTMMDVIGKLHKLESFYLSDGPITESGLSKLSRLTNLRLLRIPSTPITDSGAAKLSRLKNLTMLDLTYSGREQGKLTDKALESLGRIPHLEELDLDGHCFSDQGLAHLRGQKDLRILLVSDELHGTNITDAGLTYLKDMAKLEELGVQGSKITDKGLSSLDNLKSLQQLWLGPSISDGAVERLRRRLPKLRSVERYPIIPPEEEEETIPK